MLLVAPEAWALPPCSQWCGSGQCYVIGIRQRILYRAPYLSALWWREVDLNHRAFYRIGLQPITFNHSVISPKKRTLRVPLHCISFVG